MIQVFSQEKKRLCLLQGYTDLAIKKTLETGDKELSFKYPSNGDMKDYLQNECYIVTKEDEFVLKEVSTSKKLVKYVAILNLEELEGKQYSSFETVEQTIKTCLDTALLGTGWTVGNCNIKKRRTIRKENVCTVLDIINQCIDTYKVEVEYHTRTKVIDIYEHIGSDKGVYFMESVNLRKPPEYSIQTTGFYTQLKPIGKDGLTISVNGKDYVENYAYSTKKLMKVWKDERYTRPESLYEDAMLKLAEICRPTMTYEVDVIDLASASEEYKGILDYALGDTILLVSKSKGVKEKMRITQVTEYPEKKQNNTCQLSSTKKSFSDVQQETISEAVAEATAAAAANTTQQVEKESGITSEEIKLELEGLKTEVMKDVSDGYVAKGDAQDLATSAAETAARETQKYIDKQLESYWTDTKTQEELKAAKKDVLQQVKNEYATAEQLRTTAQTIRQEMSEQELKTAEELETQMQEVEKAKEELEAQIQELEKTKNDIIDATGAVWRMGLDEKGLYFERLGD